MNSTLTSSLVSALVTDISQVCRLFMQVPVAMSLLSGPEHRIEFANDAMSRFWEQPAEAVLGRPAIEVFPGAAQDGFEAILDQVYRTGKTLFQDIQSTITRNNVTRNRTVNVACHPFGDQSGAVTAIIVTVDEITDQKRFEEDLQRLQFMANNAGDAFIQPALPNWGYTEAELPHLRVTHLDPRDITEHKQAKEERLRFERIAEYSHDFIGACDLDGVPIYINPEGLNMVGLEDMPAAQKVVYTDFFFPEDAVFVREQLMPQVLQNNYVEMEIRLRHFRTGQPIWMNYAVFTIKNDAGEIVSIATISRNIDEHKKVEQALYLSLERFRLLADSMPQFVWTSDEQGTLNYINQSVCAYSGFNPEEITGAGWQRIVHPDDCPENWEKWKHSIAAGEVFFMEHRFRRYDGEYRWQLSRALPQEDENGQVQMWVGTSTDIHEQKTIAQDLEDQVQARTRELQEANTELERMNRELTAFAYTSSHDLQAPLRKIQSFGSRLLEKEIANLSTQGQEYFRRMQNAAQQMQLLIEDLLTYSQTGTTEKTFESINLNTLLQEVEIELEQIIQEEHAVIDVGLLPTLRVVPFQFRQLFNNLLGNALKFAHKDRPLRITVRAERQRGNTIKQPAAQPDQMYWHLSVADNGIGFDATYSNRIFEVFQRLHSKSDYIGTGIGLAICKKIVEGHRGFISADAVLGQGATFHIYLPEN